MKHFIDFADRLHVEKLLKAAAVTIFLFKLAQASLTLIVPYTKFGWGMFNPTWTFGIISNFLMQFYDTLFQPLILLALARIIAVKQATLALLARQAGEA